MRVRTTTFIFTAGAADDPRDRRRDGHGTSCVRGTRREPGDIDPEPGVPRAGLKTFTACGAPSGDRGPDVRSFSPRACARTRPTNGNEHARRRRAGNVWRNPYGPPCLVQRVREPARVRFSTSRNIPPDRFVGKTVRVAYLPPPFAPITPSLLSADEFLARPARHTCAAERTRRRPLDIP